jgi:CRP/FNR family cyclic AMP-dependent transcriptional regulator
VFGTFYMKRMLPLRLTAIASNIAFIGYAWASGLTPILVLHATLLPLNLLRLAEQRRQMARACAIEQPN